MTLGHVRAWPVPFKDGCAVASMDMSTEYEVILFTSEGRKVRCKSGANEKKRTALRLALRVAGDFRRQFAQQELAHQVIQRMRADVEKAIANRQANSAITGRMVQVRNAASSECSQDVGVIRLQLSTICSADDRRRDGVKSARLPASAAAIKIPRVLVQKRRQDGTADHPAERLIRIGSAIALGVSLGARTVSRKGVLPMLGGGKDSSAHKRKRICDGTQSKLVFLPGR